MLISKSSGFSIARNLFSFSQSFSRFRTSHIENTTDALTSVIFMGSLSNLVRIYIVLRRVRLWRFCVIKYKLINFGIPGLMLAV